MTTAAEPSAPRRRGGRKPIGPRALDPSERVLFGAIVREIVKAERLDDTPASRADVRRRLRPWINRALSEGRSILPGIAEAIDRGVARI